MDDRLSALARERACKERELLEETHKLKHAQAVLEARARLFAQRTPP